MCIKSFVTYTVQILEPWILNLERASSDIIPEIP